MGKGFSWNKFTVGGNLCKDPDMRYTPGGTAVATLRVAATSSVKEKDQWKDETLFINVVLFGKSAENAAQYLTKGSSVLVEGRLRERNWESEGQKKTAMEVIANDIKYVGGKKDSNGSSSGSGSSHNAPMPEVTGLEEM